MKKILLPLLILSTLLTGIFLSCKKERSCEGCRENNKPPIAIAGSDQVITLPTDSISLDGSTSNDPDGTISEWLWKKISGPASFNIIAANNAKTKVEKLVTGTYQFELMVTDNGSLSAKDTIQVIVDAVVTTNHPPVAKTGDDQTIILPINTVMLDGSGSSDPDNNITAYTWTKISGPSTFDIVNANAVQTQVTNLVEGVYQFELKVTDAGGLFSKDTVQKTVSNQSNRPPVANAGPDQTITLPTNAVNLDGGASSDPDNNITSYLWTKISGPASFSIAIANSVTTQATNLVEGTYKVELKVSDADGLVDSDTLRIIVNAEETVLVCGDDNRPTINAQLIHMGTLSEPRSWICVATAGDKILFNGGILADCEGSHKVDIYDFATNTWSVSERPWASGILGSGDYNMAVAVAGSKVFFAGGDNLAGCTDWYGRILLNYDAATNKWDSLDNSPVIGLGIAGASVGNKILFAGGTQGYYGYNRSKEVNIYNLSTISWSSASLSEGRHHGHAAIAVNNKIYIIGGEGSNGFSSTMDIYDNVINAWSTATMQKAKAYFGAIAVNDKLYLAGGQKHGDYSSAICEVEIIDANTGTSVIEYLSRPAKWRIDMGQNIVMKDNKIIFLRFDGGTDADRFDIYDIDTKTWSIGVLPQAIPQDASVISVNNTVYIAGGFVNGILSNHVWKLEF